VLLTPGSLQYSFRDDVATGFLGAVAGEVTPTGMSLTLLTAATDGEIVPARDVPMDAAVVYSCDPDTTAVDWLTRRKLPLVFVDQDPKPGIASINVDDRGGARAAAQHLVDLGHTRIAVLIAVIGGEAGIIADPAGEARKMKRVSRERLLGYLEALRPAGIEPTVHQQHESDDEQAHAAAMELLARADRPTAVLCFSDVVASGVYRAAYELGLDVPRDLSVVGFDDSPLARRLQPQLTTVHQDIDEKGRLAATALRTAMEQGKNGAHGRARHVVLPTVLVVRGSTAPPNG
jgi:DNA-binding LacI/PurR family transcriptional regulator